MKYGKNAFESFNAQIISNNGIIVAADVGYNRGITLKYQKGSLQGKDRILCIVALKPQYP